MLGPTGAAGTRAHLQYLRRDGVEADGRPGVVYGRDRTGLDPGGFLERARNDPAQVRFVLSPDDAAELPDLRDVTRTVLADVARDLDRDLDWVAVDHANTGRLHAHVVLRGRDLRGRTFDRSPRSLRLRVRRRAMEALTRELGPDSDRALRERLRAEARSQQLTGLDLGLVERSRSGIVDLRSPAADRHARFARARLIDRVRTLARMGLATETAPLHWALDPDAVPVLRTLGDRRETYRLLERALAEAGIRRPLRDRAVAGGPELARGVTGALLAWGDRSGARPTPYAVVDGVDGRVWYADLAGLPAGLARGASIELRAEDPDLAALDRRIETQAAARNGVWTAGRTGQAAADRRVRALARAGLADPAGVGRWRVAPDLRTRLRTQELGRRYRVARMRVLDPRPRDRDVRPPEPGGLDRPPAPGRTAPAAGRGWGAAVRTARAARRREERGVAAEVGLEAEREGEAGPVGRAGPDRGR